MRSITRAADLRRELLPVRRRGSRIGLVPTMGAFHEGHLSLMRRAREECDVVVVSLFVNPRQFNDPRDLAAYPRAEAADSERAAAQGVDYLFVPDVEEIYPDGFATTVSVAASTASLEGASRGRSHFDGVSTVVNKLFNIVGPDVAYFGQKDAQQAVVIRQMVRDLNLPVSIEVCPTVREPDGLAMSSRNALLSAADRRQAVALPRALSAVAAAVRAGATDPASARSAGLEALAREGVGPEYLELVSPDTLESVPDLDRPVLVVIAARVGEVRLIDNTLIESRLRAAPGGGGQEIGTIDNHVAPWVGATSASSGSVART
jgi:pantoate--beta-alanine ligase